MRITASVTATLQQAQSRDRNDVIKNNDKHERLREDSVSEIFSGKSRSDRIAQIKEEIKNGTYKLDMSATSDRMARSLLNV